MTKMDDELVAMRIEVQRLMSKPNASPGLAQVDLLLGRMPALGGPDARDQVAANLRHLANEVPELRGTTLGRRMVNLREDYLRDYFDRARSNRAWFEGRENWSGLYVELAVDLGRADDSRMCEAFAAAWSSPRMYGPLQPIHTTGSRNLPRPPLDPDASPHTYGIFRAPSASREIGCEVLAVRDGQSDWLDVALPTGMLGLAYSVREPLDQTANSWLPGIFRALADVANTIYERVPFEMALIGEEVSGLWYADSDVEGRPVITREVVEVKGGVVLSPRLWERLQLSVEAELLPSGLRWVSSRID